MQILQTDYEILKACRRQLQNFLPWGIKFTSERKYMTQFEMYFYQFPIITPNISELCCCKMKANCPHVRPGPTGIVPTLEVFLKDPNQYLREIWKKL